MKNWKLEERDNLLYRIKNAEENLIGLDSVDTFEELEFFVNVECVINVEIIDYEDLEESKEEIRYLIEKHIEQLKEELEVYI